MELWRQLNQAGLVPPGLGPPPQALREVSPVEIPGQTLRTAGADTGGACDSLLWIREELGNLRRVDVQLLGQLCSLGLEMGALREELVTILEEEEESSKEEEEDQEPQRKQEEEHLEACPAPHPPDFEMMI
ncbi:glutamate rich 4 [Homo sapiens]|uniref:Glutamate-rich protein 4 n=1 Tax=Homo sapiens TaxID=9606 RepID=ERIC4_HUMAN|nr:glutamate-rich protein 4 [Homo sapiens]A6NGS2.2 RecName: Full=Glutamate-rich protein 4 [Homo sapiens]KAI2591235.1 glutamate rich 4 [Homo sapiens]KAI4042897.1 glutamate rich 4 [Homo sapiens]|eukprot:NP_001123986.1 glutamate-rich protein 4 [Homo sapiens]